MIRLRRMYSPAEEHRNFMNFLSISQYEDQVPWTFRRLAAFETSDNVNSHEYYVALDSLVYNNGHPRRAHKAVRAWAYESLHLGFTGDELEKMRRDLVPQTALYRRLLIKNLPQVDQWLYQQLKESVSVKRNNELRSTDAETKANVPDALVYYNLVVKECLEAGMSMVQGEYGVYESFEKCFLRTDGKFDGEAHQWPEVDVPEVIKKKTMWFHVYVKDDGDFDYKRWEFTDFRPTHKPTKTWEDVAYWYNHLKQSDILAKDWNRWVGIEDWYLGFKESMVSTRHTIAGKTAFVNTVMCMLGGREPLEAENVLCDVYRKILNGGTIMIKENRLYWKLHNLYQSKLNWASKHYTDVTVFDV